MTSFFAALLKSVCDGKISTFLSICNQINMPISLEKTYWGTTQLIFLGTTDRLSEKNGHYYSSRKDQQCYHFDTRST